MTKGHGYIQRITGTIPHTHKVVDIAVGGRNLIITGGNGSGKTSFLQDMWRKTQALIVLIINPYEDRPEEHIVFIGWIAFPRQGSERGDYTIQTIQLNRPDLDGIRGGGTCHADGTGD